MPRAGDIHWVPREASYHNDPKDRLHSLLTGCDAHRHGIAVYGSTSKAEVVKHTICLTVNPRRSGAYQNGLSRQTHFYPAILRPVAERELDNQVGRLTDTELQELRRLLPPALGFGTGNCYARGAAMRSKRGMVVEVESNVAVRTHARFGVVMASHPYSASDDGFLAIAPLLLDYEPEPNQDLLIEKHVMSFELLEADAESAIMMVTNIYSIRVQQVTRMTPLCVPSTQLEQAETLLKRWVTSH